MYNNKEIQKKGFIDWEIDKKIDLHTEIRKMCKEKNAIILAHYYVDSKIQDVADYVGDSLGLSQQAANTDADIIVFAGVHFMAETAKILSPHKKIIIPDLKSGCPMADSMPAEAFEEFLKDYPDHVVVTYVNTTADIKALSDITCTSSNAKEIIDSLPREQKIVFGPDKNLGGYINSITGREMVLWDGLCIVHENFSAERLKTLKKEHDDAIVLAHPECNKEVLSYADVIGSTAKILNFTKESSNNKFIIATEPGIIHKMKEANPDKIYIPLPPKNPHMLMSICRNMKKHTIKKVYNALKFEQPEVILEDELIRKAKKPIERMLEMGK